jgi:hypothetical protein
MANMGHCRFQNTLEDLRDCWDYMGDELSENETTERERLIELCCRIAKNYSEDEEY